MSIDDTIRIHLQKLAEKKSWRANELPQGCTVNVLRVLDDRGLIEFRLWERAEPNPQPFENPDPPKMVVRPNKYCDWFSPVLQPNTAGDLSAVLAHGKDDPDLAPEIRVSEHGKARLAELEMAALAEELQGSAPHGADPAEGTSTAGGTHAKKKGRGRPAMDAAEQELAKKFCEGKDESGLTLRAYCEREEIKLKTGKRWRDWVTASRKPRTKSRQD